MEATLAQHRAREAELVRGAVTAAVANGPSSPAASPSSRHLSAVMGPASRLRSEVALGNLWEAAATSPAGQPSYQWPAPAGAARQVSARAALGFLSQRNEELSRENLALKLAQASPRRDSYVR